MAPSTPQIIELDNNNINYNCTECSSLIEIIFINEKDNIIKFKCIDNNHEKEMNIKEYLEKMEKYKNNKIKEKCEKHNNEFIIYCFDCKYHLCKECLKSKIHKKHNKNDIYELQPTKEELNIINNKLIKYNKEIENIKIEKNNKIKELDNLLYKEKENKNKKLKIKIENNKKKEEKELIKNNKNYIKELKKIKNKYEKKIKEIKNKYKIINNNENIKNENIKEELNNKINKIKENLLYDKKIDNILNIKKLNIIIYNTYNKYNNNYYYSLNINNIINNNKIEDELNNIINNKNINYIINEININNENINKKIRIINSFE